MATHDTDALIASLEREPALLIPLIREVPVANLKRRPAPDKWSAHEHACHLATEHQLFFERLEQMLTEDDPVVVPYDPGNTLAGQLAGMDLDQALADFAQERGALIKKLRALTPAQWERTGRHAEYDRYTVFIMFRHLLLHGMLHGYRIEQLVAKREW